MILRLPIIPSSSMCTAQSACTPRPGKCVQFKARPSVRAAVVVISTLRVALAPPFGLKLRRASFVHANPSKYYIGVICSVLLGDWGLGCGWRRGCRCEGSIALASTTLALRLVLVAVTVRIHQAAASTLAWQIVTTPLLCLGQWGPRCTTALIGSAATGTAEVRLNRARFAARKCGYSRCTLIFVCIFTAIAELLAKSVALAWP